MTSSCSGRNTLPPEPQRSRLAPAQPGAGSPGHGVALSIGSHPAAPAGEHGARGRALVGGHRPGPPAHLAVLAVELLEGEPGDLAVRPAAAARRHREEFGRHHREVVVGLVPVCPRAEVDLCQRVQPVPRRGVEQRGQLHAVADRDAQRLDQAPAGRPLAGQRLHHAGQVRPPQAEHRPRDQFGNPTALGGDRTVRLGPHPRVEPLDQQRLPQRFALAPVAPQLGRDVAGPCTTAPASAAASAVASVESESMTTSSSTSGASATRARCSGPTTPATVRSSFLAGITTLIRAPCRCLSSSSCPRGQSRQCEVRRRYQASARWSMARRAPVWGRGF